MKQQETLVELKNICKSFDGKSVLNNLDLKIYNGEFLTILGPSGCGKTTTLRLIAGFEQADSGDILLQGKRINNIPANNREVHTVFQNYNLFPHLTVLKNIIEGPVHVLKEDKESATKRAYELLKKVGLADKADAYPQQLSGGQAQRVAIARSLAMNPRYILLDEPTSALDPELELEVLKVLLQLAKEKQSLIIVTHNLAFAQKVADKILFVEDGQILFQGPKDDFFNSDNQRIKNFLSAMTLSNLD